MGLNTKTESDTKIVMIKHKSLCLESKEPKDGYVETQVEIPNTDDGHGNPETMIKYIKSFKSLDGYVKELEWYNTEEKHSRPYLGVKIHMEDDGEQFILDIPYDRQYFNTFCKIAENIDFTERVEFYASPDKDGKGTRFGASQNGVGVKYRYTKENPGQMPLGKQNKTTKKWDFSAQNEWLLNNLIENVIPAVNAQLGVAEKTVAAAAGAGDRWADVGDPIHN